METDLGYNFASGSIVNLTTVSVQGTLYIFVLARPGVTSEVVDFSTMGPGTSLMLIPYDIHRKEFGTPSLIASFGYQQVFPINLKAQYHNGRFYLIIQSDFNFSLNNGVSFDANPNRIVTVLCKLDEFFSVSHYLRIACGNTGNVMAPYDFTMVSGTMYFIGSWAGFLQLPGVNGSPIENPVLNAVYGYWKPFGKQPKNMANIETMETEMDRCTAIGNGVCFDILYTNQVTRVIGGQIVLGEDCSIPPVSKAPITNQTRTSRRESFSRPCLYMTLSHYGALSIAGTRAGDGCNLRNANLLVLKMDLGFRAINQNSINARFNVNKCYINNTMIIQQDGDLFLAGIFVGRYNVGRSMTLDSIGQLSQYVVRLSDDEWQWTQQIANNFTTIGGTIDVSPRPVYNGLSLNLMNDTLILGSHFWHKIQFGDLELTGTGASDYYMVNLDIRDGEFSRPRIIPCSNISGYNNLSDHVGSKLHTLITRSIDSSLATVSVVEDMYSSY